MARYRRTIHVPVTREEAFDFLARFSSAASWDPGVASATMDTPEPVGLGSAFVLQVRSFGRAVPFRYEIVRFERPEAVALTAVRSPFVSEDTITFADADADADADAAGTRLTYDAHLRLTGPARLLAPLLEVVFRRIGDRAMDGLLEAFERGAGRAA